MADEGHYRGRIKRLENWQEISKIVTHKLSKLTMICILDEARLEVFQKLEAKERIPCSMYWVDVVFLYCFHLLEYDSYHQLEKKYQIPHSTAQSVINFMVQKTKKINKRFVQPFDYQKRLEITQEYIETGEMDRKYARITVSIDATHRLWNKDHTGKKSLFDWSYKLKDFGYNVLFGGFVNGYFFFCGKVFGAASNDKTLIQNGFASLCDVLDEKDLIICDGIFRDAIRTEDRRNTLICQLRLSRNRGRGRMRRGRSGRSVV